MSLTRLVWLQRPNDVDNIHLELFDVHYYFYYMYIERLVWMCGS